MSNIVFFTYGSTLELNGEQFEAGRLTEELLNLSPAQRAFRYTVKEGQGYPW